MTRHLPIVVTMLTFATPALAQKVTIVPDLTGQQVLSQLANAGSARGVGEAIALTTALEIATQPFAGSSGGFIFKLDPTTGLLARTTTTFGPAFGERALTSGEGQITVGATFRSTTFDKLGDFGLTALPLSTIAATSPSVSRTTTGNLAVTGRTVALSTTVGVSENFDVAVIVPMISVKLVGSTAVVNGSGVVTRLAETNSIFAGIGDISALAKYRLVKFGGTDIPDPGGIAVVVNSRLPTGSRENLRGLGIARTLVSGVVSGNRGRLTPHASAGFEYWNKSLDIAGGSNQKISVRHQVQYSGGIEIEAAPKVTLLVDYLGQSIFGGGQIGLADDALSASLPNVTSAMSMVALGKGISKGMLIPGLKANLKGKLLLSLSAIITLQNNGLHSRVTPVVGINLTM
ncbi:MAG: hypothetical protein ABJC51_03480 [Acidobacteriota bacterium]